MIEKLETAGIFIGTLVVDSFFMTLSVAIVVALVFYWLNRSDSKVDERYYDHTFNPEKDLKANIFRGKEKEPDPEKVLKPYSQLKKDE